MSRFRPAVLLLSVAVLALAACGGSGSSDDPAAGYEPMELAAFNKTIKPGSGLSSSPRQLAQRFLGLRPDLMIEEKISDDSAVITVLVEGLADDSVRARRYRVEFERGEDGWKISWAGWQQRCHSQRGHQDFSSELCI